MGVPGARIGAADDRAVFRVGLPQGPVAGMSMHELEDRAAMHDRVIKCMSHKNKVQMGAWLFRPALVSQEGVSTLSSERSSLCCRDILQGLPHGSSVVCALSLPSFHAQIPTNLAVGCDGAVCTLSEMSAAPNHSQHVCFILTHCLGLQSHDPGMGLLICVCMGSEHGLHKSKACSPRSCPAEARRCAVLHCLICARLCI